MNRADSDLATILKYENVAWYSDGAVTILDRRCYPMEVKYVRCTSHTEVAQAIEEMVTQSAGPYTAAGMGMALASYEFRKLKGQNLVDELTKAAELLHTARPTTSSRMKKVTDGCLEAAKSAIRDGREVDEAIFKRTLDSLNRRYRVMEVIAENLVARFPDQSRVMTQCYGETIVGMMLRECRRKGISSVFIVPETRPYLQGARLTASVISEMGFECTVITDNMAAFAMSELGVNLFTSAADSITKDGFVVNKVGTLQLAILAKYFGIPYYVTGIPDTEKTISEVRIEYRNPEEVLTLGGNKHTLKGVQAVYPSFDITPPELVMGVVTDTGVYLPGELGSYRPLNREFY